MDINELNGLLSSVITDDHSTEKCRRGFEKNLGVVESRGPEFTERTFMRHRTFFRDALLGIQALSDTPINGQAVKIDQLQRAITGVSKADAFEVVRNARSLLRKQIPEFKKHDEIEKVLKQNMGTSLDDGQIEKTITSIMSGDIDTLLTSGVRLPEEKKLGYYRTLSTYLPDEKRITGRLIHVLRTTGQKTGDKRLLLEALEKMSQIPFENPDELVDYAKLTTHADSKKHMKNALELLEKHLNNPDCLVSFGLVARRMKDRRAMTIAMEKLEDDRESRIALTTYAKLARTAHDEIRMGISLEELETQLDDERCLVQYAALAKDLHDEEKMEIAMVHLVDKLHNPKCLTIYATIVKVLNDKTEMTRCIDLLEKHIDTDDVALGTYGELARRLNDKYHGRIAMKKLETRQKDPRNKQLYVALAKRQYRTSIPRGIYMGM